MTAYARLVAKYRRLAAGAEAVQRQHPDLAIALLPHALAALVPGGQVQPRGRG